MKPTHNVGVGNLVILQILLIPLKSSRHLKLNFLKQNILRITIGIIFLDIKQMVNSLISHALKPNESKQKSIMTYI